MIYVLDSSAMIAVLRQEPGADVVRGLLRAGESVSFAHAINLCEVYYDSRCLAGHEVEEMLGDVYSLGVQVREDMDEAFWKQAGGYKADLRRISLADCFCMALANRVGGEVVTADHHEFSQASEQGLCTVTFIR